MKALFSVPEGQKVTEKQLHRVLLTSICSILLCMSCLAGSTWAWFAASVENTDNEILIAQPGVVLKIGDTTYIKGTTLEDIECIVRIEHANEKDVFEQKSTLHVVVKVQSGDEEIQRRTILNEENGYTTEITIRNESEYVFTIDAVAYWSHDVPSDVEPIGEDNIIWITAGESADEEEEPTEPPTTEPDETETTVPTDPTDPSVPETFNPSDNDGKGDGGDTSNGTGGDDTMGSDNGGNTDPDGQEPGSENPSGSDNSGSTEPGGDDPADPVGGGNTDMGDDTTTGTNPEDPTNSTTSEETGET